MKNKLWKNGIVIGLVLLFIGASVTSIVSINVRAATVSLPFFDDFENIANGVYPSANGWKNMYSGSTSYVSTAKAYSGSKSFCLKAWSSWARTDYIEIDTPDIFSYEACVLVEDTSKGTHVGFSEAAGSYNPRYNCILFANDGNIYFKRRWTTPVTLLQSYSANTWYKVKAELDFTDNTADIYINDVLKASDLEIIPKEYNDPRFGYIFLDRFSLALNNFASGGTSTVYFDDINLKSQSDNPIDKYALLHGIIHYPVSGDLSAPESVIENIEQFLRVGFDYDVVYGFDNTEQQIRDAIDTQLKQNADENDIKFYYFTGHGFSMNLGEYIAIRENPSEDLWDYELNDIFSDLENFAAIFDNCHSGGLCHVTDESDDFDANGNQRPSNGIEGDSKIIGMSVASHEKAPDIDQYSFLFIDAFTGAREKAIDSISGDDNRVSMEEALKYVKKRFLYWDSYGFWHGYHPKIFDGWPTENDNSDQFYLSPDPIDSEYISIKVKCPVTPHLYDEYGNHVGLNDDGNVERQIDGVVYSGFSNDNKLIVIFNSDSYPKLDIVINGDEDGFFTLECKKYDDETQNTYTIIYSNIQITEDSIANFCITDGIFGDLEVDFDGDSIIDEIVEPFRSDEPIFVPTALFSYEISDPPFELEVEFNASYSYDLEGNIITYNWDFGDGTTTQGKIVTHSYSSHGKYSVNLTVTDNDGLSHTIQKSIEIIIPSTIDIDPDILLLNSRGIWITSYIELPESYDVVDIKTSTILLNDTISVETRPINISDYDEDGIPDLMIKFDRQDVIDILEVGDNVEIKITGQLFDETQFEGTDYIKVI